LGKSKQLINEIIIMKKIGDGKKLLMPYNQLLITSLKKDLSS